jgi:DNA-directed RNA polymerase subunit RPC12/RpoP
MFEINLPEDQAQAVVGVLRAMEAGLCPRCQKTFAIAIIPQGQAIVCPKCSFFINGLERDHAEKVWRYRHTRNLQIFEKWRKGEKIDV